MQKLIILLIFSIFSGQLFAERGMITGGQSIEFPEWKKESFLDITEDVEEAKNENKHVILFFHLQGCPYCSTMMRESFVESKNVDFIKDNFDLIELDVKGDREVTMDADTTISEKNLAEKLKVFSTPTILFLDQTGKIKLRLNGYRSRFDFDQALNFVQSKRYANLSFARYLADKRSSKVYDFIDNKHFVKTSDLSGLKHKPVALIFEDSACATCKEFHEKMLQNEKIDQVLEGLHVLRLDTNSNDKFKDFAGKLTTALQLSEKYNMTFRPGVVFVYEGKEVARIGGMLRTFHNLMMFRFVSEKGFLEYEDWLEFAGVEQEKLLAAGKNIDIWE